MKSIIYLLYWTLFNQQVTFLIIGFMIPCVPIMRIKLNKKKCNFIKKIIPDIIGIVLFILNILAYLYIEELFEDWDGLIILFSYLVFAVFYILDIITSIGYIIYKFIKKKSMS